MNVDALLADANDWLAAKQPAPPPVQNLLADAEDWLAEHPVKPLDAQTVGAPVSDDPAANVSATVQRWQDEVPFPAPAAFQDWLGKTARQDALTGRYYDPDAPDKRSVQADARAAMQKGVPEQFLERFPYAAQHRDQLGKFLPKLYWQAHKQWAPLRGVYQQARQFVDDEGGVLPENVSARKAIVAKVAKMPTKMQNAWVAFVQEITQPVERGQVGAMAKELARRARDVGVGMESFAKRDLPEMLSAKGAPWLQPDALPKPRTALELEQLAYDVVEGKDPNIKEGALAQAAVQAAGMLPHMAAIAAGGPVGMAAAGSSMAGQAARRYRARGYTPRDAAVAGVAEAALELWMETLQVGHLKKLAKAGKLRTRMLDGVVQFLKTGAYETVEEGTQALGPLGVQWIFDPANGVPKKDRPTLAKAWTAFHTTVGETFLPMMMMSAGGGAVRVAGEGVKGLERRAQSREDFDRMVASAFAGSPRVGPEGKPLVQRVAEAPSDSRTDIAKAMGKKDVPAALQGKKDRARFKAVAERLTKRSDDLYAKEEADAKVAEARGQTPTEATETAEAAEEEPDGPVTAAEATANAFAASVQGATRQAYAPGEAAPEPAPAPKKRPARPKTYEEWAERELDKQDQAAAEAVGEPESGMTPAARAGIEKQVESMGNVKDVDDATKGVNDAESRYARAYARQQFGEAAPAEQVAEPEPQAPAAPAPQAEAEQAKQPWEMTRGEVAESEVGKTFVTGATTDPAVAASRGESVSVTKVTPKGVKFSDGKFVKFDNFTPTYQHRRAVEEALKAGHPVPAEVLADYPDLAKEAPGPVQERHAGLHPRAVLEIDRAVEAGEMSPQVGAMVKYLVELDPSFDVNTLLEVLGAEGSVTPESMVAHGLDPADAERHSQAGAFSVRTQGEIMHHVLKLYKNHDAQDVAHEWAHRYWYLFMSAEERYEYTQWHRSRKTGDSSKSPVEAYADAAAEYFLGAVKRGKVQGLGGLRKGAVRRAYAKARDMLLAALRWAKGALGLKFGAKLDKLLAAPYKKYGARKPGWARGTKRIMAAEAQEGAMLPADSRASVRREQTKSPAFKRWFGKSKVVDEKGEPLVVYHGTSKPGFPSFDPARSAGSLGVHAGSAQQASGAAGAATRGVYPVYLTIKNPLRLPDAGAWTAEHVVPALREAGVIGEAQEAEAKRHEGGGTTFEEQRAWLRKTIKAAGYDGVVYQNRYEGYAAEDTGRPEWWQKAGSKRLTDAEWRSAFPRAADAYIAFDATQIKSATGNRGTFDPGDPELRHAGLHPQTRTAAFKRWFGKSKVVDEKGEPLVVYHGTVEKFAAFEAGEFGFHFGDEVAANMQGVPMPVYLSIKNPVRMRDMGMWSPEDVASELWSMDVFDDDTLSEVKGHLATAPAHITDAVESDDVVESGKAHYQLSGPVREALREAGYDGIVYKNEAEGYADSYIAFSPTQIKSATGNRGTFDPGDPDMRASIREVKSATGNRGTFDPGDPELRHAGLHPQAVLEMVNPPIARALARFEKAHKLRKGAPDFAKELKKRVAEMRRDVEADRQRLANVRSVVPNEAIAKNTAEIAKRQAKAATLKTPRARARQAQAIAALQAENAQLAALAANNTRPLTPQEQAESARLTDTIKDATEQADRMETAARGSGIYEQLRSLFAAPEGLQQRTMDMVFENFGHLSMADRNFLLEHREDPGKHPIPRGASAELKAAAKLQDALIEGLEREMLARDLIGQWPGTMIARNETTIQEHVEKIAELKTQKAIDRHQAEIDRLTAENAVLVNLRYVRRHVTGKRNQAVLDSQLARWHRDGSLLEKVRPTPKLLIGRKYPTLQSLRDAGIPIEEDAAVALGMELAYGWEKVGVHDFHEYVKKTHPELVQDKLTAPADWVPMHGALPQYKGYLVHPDYADAIRDYTASQGKDNVLLRGLDQFNAMFKQVKFYNAFVMGFNNIMQQYGATGVGPTVKGLFTWWSKARKDVNTRSALYQLAQSLDVFSIPTDVPLEQYLSLLRHGLAMVNEAPGFKRWLKNLGHKMGIENWKQLWKVALPTQNNALLTGMRALTWKMDRVMRMATFRTLYEKFERKGMPPLEAAQQAAIRARKFHADYNVQNAEAGKWARRLMLTPAYQTAMWYRLFPDIVKEFGAAGKKALTAKGRANWTALDTEGVMVPLRLLAYKVGMVGLMAHMGYAWVEGYRFVKREEPDEEGGDVTEKVFLMFGPWAEPFKAWGRAASGYRSGGVSNALARVFYNKTSPLLHAAWSMHWRGRDWRGRPIYSEVSKTDEVVRGQETAWFLLNELYPIVDQVWDWGKAEQTTFDNVVRLFAITHYTRKPMRTYYENKVSNKVTALRAWAKEQAEKDPAQAQHFFRRAADLTFEFVEMLSKTVQVNEEATAAMAKPWSIDKLIKAFTPEMFWGVTMNDDTISRNVQGQLLWQLLEGPPKRPTPRRNEMPAKFQERQAEHRQNVDQWRHRREFLKQYLDRRGVRGAEYNVLFREQLRRKKLRYDRARFRRLRALVGTGS